MAKKTKEIEALDERISSFRKKNAKHVRKVSAQEDEYSRAAAGFQISTELLAGVLVGAAIGYFLDGLFETKPWLLALFTIFGGAAGILNVYRSFKDDTPHKRRN